MQVLLVETDAPLVRLMAWFLVEAGFVASKVDLAGDIVGRAIECGADVVVFNTGLPPGEKRHYIELLHESVNAPKVLDVSDGAHRTFPDTSADAYLMQPFDADDLVASVRNLV